VLAALALLAVLTILFSGLLDGLSLGGSAALRELRVDLIVLDDSAQGQIGRSRVPDDVRQTVAATTGVAETGALAHVRLPVKRAGGQIELVSLLAADHRPRSVESDLGDGAAIDDALAPGVSAPARFWPSTRRRSRLSGPLAGWGLAWVAARGWSWSAGARSSPRPGRISRPPPR
jgi:hypothetical protein